MTGDFRRQLAQRVRSQERTAIMIAVRQLMAVEGDFHLDQVVQRAGVSLATLLDHFSTKSDLMVQVMMDRLARYLADWAVRQQPLDLVEALTLWRQEFRIAPPPQMVTLAQTALYVALSRRPVPSSWLPEAELTLALAALCVSHAPWIMVQSSMQALTHGN